jgi:hypothetical protein
MKGTLLPEGWRRPRKMGIVKGAAPFALRFFGERIDSAEPARAGGQRDVR